MPIVTVVAVSIIASRPGLAQAPNYVWVTYPTITLTVDGKSIPTTWPVNNPNEGTQGSCSQSAMITYTGGTLRWLGSGTPTSILIYLPVGIGGDMSANGSFGLGNTFGDYLPGVMLYPMGSVNGVPWWNFSGQIEAPHHTGLKGRTVTLPTYTEWVSYTGGASGSYAFNEIAE